MSHSFLEYLKNELELFFEPISTRLRVGAIADLMAELGWYWPEVAELDIGEVIESLDSLIERLAQLDDDSEPSEYINALKLAIDVIESLGQLQNKLPNPNDFEDDVLIMLQVIQDDAEKIGERALGLLIVRYLEVRIPALLGVLELCGVIYISRVLPQASNPGFNNIEINWGNISKLVIEPENLFEILYNWGSSDPLKIEDFLGACEAIALGLGLPVGLKSTPFRLEKAIVTTLGSDISNVTLGRQLEIPLLQIYSDESGYAELGLRILGAPDPNHPSDGINGIALVPFATGQQGLDIAITKDLKLRTRGSFGADFAILLFPNGRIEFLEGLLTSGGIDLALAAHLVHEGIGVPLIIFGSKKGSRFEYSKLEVNIGLSGSPSDPDLFAEMLLKDASIVVQGSEGDGFLGKILPKEPIIIKLDFAAGFSSKRGFYFGGSSGFEVTIPFHQSIGPIVIESVYLALILGFKDHPGFAANVALSAGVELGPISASIERLGVKAVLSFPGEGQGNFGSAELGIGFLPPIGAGLAIDAEGIIGGGYLKFEKERYTGILALSFGDIALTAIGLITTKPDFSMLINIGIIFDPPFQLAYGFTLSGVGGMIGINRTMVTEALQKGFKNRTIDSILMPDPKTVIANASKIISDLGTVFQPQVDRFVIGPMIKIGWGVPKNIITADIGIFIEIPDPIRIALMGKIRAYLPESEEAIISINMDILGVLDLDKKQLSFQTSIYDSKILTFHLFGDTAFLLSWGENPEFSMALGGFHPKFPAPPPPYIFADLKRLSLNITFLDILVLDCAAYQAITPNSLQFGASLDLYVSIEVASLEGHLSFDALFYFSPFSFEVSISGAVIIKALGESLVDIDIFLLLAGPRPWNARGRAKVHILFFCISADFNLIWGDPMPVIQPAANPWPQLCDALEQPASWGSALPRGMMMVEALRSDFVETETETGVVVVHPFGTLEIRQNVVPLNITIQKFGNSPVAGSNHFCFSRITVEGHVIERLAYVEEFFARGDYEYLTNQQKLSLPSFEKMIGGVALGSRLIKTYGKLHVKEIGYKTILLKTDRTSELQPDCGSYLWKNAEHLVVGAAAAKSPLHHRGFQKFAVAREVPKVQFEEELYCIVRESDLSLAPDSLLDFGERYCIIHAEDLSLADLDPEIALSNRCLTRKTAEQAIAAQGKRHPEQTDGLTAIPAMTRMAADQIMATHSDKAEALLVVPMYEVKL